MTTAAVADLLPSKFRGCLIGGLLGDCVGEPFEVEISEYPGHFIPLGNFGGSASAEGITAASKISKFLSSLLKESPEAGVTNLLDYTDDTAMALSVAKSLVEKGTYDAKDMAKKFVDEYNRAPDKGYGGNVVVVLRALGRNKFQDVYGPSKQQFEGRGSYGNGAAMRVAPVALFGFNDEDLIKKIAKESALLTHSNQHGYNGAILQALAVHQALLADPSSAFNPVQFVNTLLEKMEQIEEEVTDAGSGAKQKTYCESLKLMKKILEEHPVITARKVATLFGNHVVAHKSVPAAIYSFLRGFQPLEDFESDSPFVRTLYFAISVGGDTDTIGCMAGSIAGAYHGESAIPETLMKRCEATDELKSVGNMLFEINQSQKSERKNIETSSV